MEEAPSLFFKDTNAHKTQVNKAYLFQISLLTKLTTHVPTNIDKHVITKSSESKTNELLLNTHTHTHTYAPTDKSTQAEYTVNCIHPKVSKWGGWGWDTH